MNAHVPHAAPAPGPAASVDELIQAALDLARTCLGMDVGFVTEVHNGVRVFRHVSSIEGFAPIRVGDYDPAEQTYCQRIIDGDIPAILQDSHLVPELQALHCTGLLQIRAHIGVPVFFSDGSVFGTFCCYSRDPHAQLSHVNVAALQRFAWLLGQLLESRVRTERAREQRLERVQEVIADGCLQVVYQPVIDVTRRSVVGYEALARFHCDPRRSPDQWFDEAHGVELGSELELMAIERALAGLQAIPEQLYMGLNVSPQTIMSGALGDVLHGVPLPRVMLEVTEHSSIGDYEPIARALAPLRARGLRLAVDDAGSGFASFRHILKLKPDVIKLDQSLIRDIDRDPGSRALASALIVFASQTGSGVIAEGVETEAELDTLRTLGVTTVQGYLLGRPAALPIH